MCAQFKINLTQDQEAMSKSQNLPKIMCFTQKRSSHSAYTVQEGIICNYITIMKVLLTNIPVKCYTRGYIKLVKSIIKLPLVVGND